jgi:hypothetical protein
MRTDLGGTQSPYNQSREQSVNRLDDQCSRSQRSAPVQRRGSTAPDAAWLRATMPISLLRLPIHEPDSGLAPSWSCLIA